LIRLFAACGAVLLATGCASIVGGHNQPVSVETKYKGENVAGAQCKLENDKGSWNVTTPGSVTVRRSIADMLVSCTKEGTPPGSAKVKSSTKPMAFGNILFGGIIGVGVDVATGAAYDYPSLMALEMGQAISDAPAPADTAPAAGAAAPAAGGGTQPGASAPAVEQKK
jgi:hypothetical protein